MVSPGRCRFRGFLASGRRASSSRSMTKMRSHGMPSGWVVWYTRAFLAKRPIRFGVVSAVRQLPDVGQMGAVVSGTVCDVLGGLRCCNPSQSGQRLPAWMRDESCREATRQPRLPCRTFVKRTSSPRLRGGKSGQHREPYFSKRRRVQRNVTDSATEIQTADGPRAQARVKRWGKGPPAQG